MRPLRLAGVRVLTCGEEDVLHAWSRLNEWILRKNLRRDVEIGYGLVGFDEAGFNYAACIELPDAATSTEAEELSRANLQGGAYMRSRYAGPISQICGELEAMRGKIGDEGHTRLDIKRPLVSVFLDAKNIVAGEDVRSNLLVPVCRSEVSNTASEAA